MKTCNLKIIYNGEEKQISCNQGDNLMAVLNENNIYVDAPCGGKCVCGKCKIRIDNPAEHIADEQRFFTKEELIAGYRLACVTKVTQSTTIYVNNNPKSAKIQTDGKMCDYRLNPVVKKYYLKMDKPSLQSQQTDVERIEDAIGIEGLTICHSLIKKIPSMLRECDYCISAVVVNNELIHLEKGDTIHDCYGVAIDIGTTTVASYLLNLQTGEKIAVASRLNSQKPYGADVISRINYTIENKDGLDVLYEKITGQLDEMIINLAESVNICTDNIYAVMIVGNTTMMHLLTGYDPKYIASAPFIPVTVSQMVLDSKQININSLPFAKVFLVPSVSGYVGADIVSAVIATDASKSEKNSLIVDIGTNGEVALGNSKSMICCSTAAGPAFEGAQIKYGMGGVNGAISKLTFEDSEVSFDVIGGMEPSGICGSGIVDAIAELLKIGAIDETGRMVDDDEYEPAFEKYSKRLVDVDGNNEFVICDGVNITSRDVRVIQLGKAAIRAGINTLIKRGGLETKDIDKIYLAGGFGSYLDKKSACDIGLLPKELFDKIEVVGNAAGSGSIAMLLDEDLWKYSATVNKKMEYIELSSDAGFQDEYVDCMMFE